MQKSASYGVNLQKEWSTFIDGRQRDTHGALDGAVVAQEELFVTTAGNALMFPGDPNAPAEEVINCRCVMIPRVAMTENKLNDADERSIIAMDESVVANAIKNSAVSNSLKESAQKRHIQSADGYVPGRSYLYGSLEEAKRLIDSLSGTGAPVFSESGLWVHKERVTADHVIGVAVDPVTKEEKETDNAMIHYSKQGAHIVPRK